MDSKPERRYLLREQFPDAISVERRDGSPPVLVGISPPWDSLSVDLGGFREKFAPVAFDGLVDRSPNDPRGKIDVPFLQDHVSYLISGRTTNGRLEIRKEPKGLGYRHTPIDTQHGIDLVKLVDDRTITGSSFAFTTAPDGDQWTEDEKGNVIRTVFKADGLYDISAVTYPAYPRSSAQMERSIREWKSMRGLIVRREDRAKPITVAIDYDSAFVAATGLWRSLIEDAAQRGDEVLLVSAAAEQDRVAAHVREATGGLDVRTVFVPAGKRKREAVQADAWVLPSADESAPAVKVSTLLGARAAASAAAARMRLAIGAHS